ncbi:alpha/beta hydrolase [Rheinheimera baltica]|uniref:Alpha/beta hydrolase n=2 Tax=Rheinheimera baltica TaxID=67576 RepID=A0ABT9HX52_9GAMM|nr:alpha/beta hydrolase [Rheinheimera baltica]MDP5135558.1 alpha/beta hydrolase [Rheinheimera baltica]MDP5151207.1 alpha/beta hydrolase [Rheinheimera baltica]
MKVVVSIFAALSFTLGASQSQFINVNEFELEYEIAGNGKHTVLLEAGASSAMTDWDPVFSQIAEQATVIRYSRVGNGNSTQVKRHFTSRDYADYASELLDKLQVAKPVILVAHSYGGSIARDFAAAYPDKVKALLMLDPSSEHDVDVLRAIDLEQGNKEIAAIKLDDMKNGMSNNYLDFWSKRPLPDYPKIKDMPVTVIASVKKTENPANLFFTDQGRKLWGEHWHNWAADFPQGRAVLTDKSGHFVQFDEPNLVLTELQRLITKLNKTKHK